MTFIQSLTDIVDRIEGCAGAVILGIDGIPIERYMPDLDPELDLDLVATELTTLLRHSMRVASDAELGWLREMMFNTDRQTFLLRPITEDYFLLLALNPGGNVGRARFELRKVQLALESEFAI
ncbi:MAG TPA: roadblock/LC7 domain-containing protein [Blastocatellia bacterium]|nr:roadblock/LC7 domain-containing protein [Blastocatellia bacterium]